MVLEEGDFVKIRYTGKIKESGNVFDTTEEKVAKEAGIYEENIKFKSQPIVIGAGHVIPGLEEALVGMEVGETKNVDVPAEKGYGSRDPGLIKTVPLKEFKRQGLSPYPGMRVESEDKIGRVQSVSGGRVRVDFNYELAGKNLSYKITVEEKTNKTEEKIRHLLERHFPYAEQNDHEIEIKNGTSYITLSEIVKVKKEALVGKHYVSSEVFKYIEGIDEVHFIEIFKNPEKKKEMGEEKGKEEKQKEPTEKASEKQENK